MRKVLIPTKLDKFAADMLIERNYNCKMTYNQSHIKEFPPLLLVPICLIKKLSFLYLEAQI